MKRSVQGFTLVEVLLAAVIIGLIFPTAMLLMTTWKSLYYTGGFAQVGSTSVPYAPSYSQRLVADSVLAMLREDDQSAALTIGVAAEVSPSYVGSSGRMAQVLNAPLTQLCDPTSCEAYLRSAGVPFTTNPGFTVFVLGQSAQIIAIYACNYVDSAGIRVYTVRRTTASSSPTVAYSFAELSTKAQPTPSLALGALASYPAKFLQVRFPDPACRLGDQITRLDLVTDATARAAAIVNLRRTAQYVVYLHYRR